jgi:Flp pilus assembly protein TadG
MNRRNRHNRQGVVAVEMAVCATIVIPLMLTAMGIFHLFYLKSATLHTAATASTMLTATFLADDGYGAMPEDVAQSLAQDYAAHLGVTLTIGAEHITATSAPCLIIGVSAQTVVPAYRPEPLQPQEPAQ